METREIEINSIKVSDLNTRKDLDAGTEDASLTDLAASIEEKGLLNPIIVRTAPDGQYDLIAGQRRFLACRQLGMATISASIRDDLDDADAAVVSLVENVQRADMNPIDKAMAYQGIYERYGSEQRVAKETGVTPKTVRRYLFLLNLAPSIRDKMTTSEGPAGVETLELLAKTFAPQDQEEVLQHISGFKRDIQKDILRRSDGDLTKIPGLTGQAMEGAFDTQLCRDGLCFEMPDELKARVKTLLDQGNLSLTVASESKQLTGGS